MALTILAASDNDRREACSVCSAEQGPHKKGPTQDRKIFAA